MLGYKYVSVGVVGLGLLGGVGCWSVEVLWVALILLAGCLRMEYSRQVGVKNRHAESSSLRFCISFYESIFVCFLWKVNARMQEERIQYSILILQQLSPHAADAAIMHCQSLATIKESPAGEYSI